jgi:CRISPR-associated endonuclease Cas1
MNRQDPTGGAQPFASERLRDLFADRDDRPAIAVVDGHGVRLSVNRGQLRALDGVADAARLRSWSRASHGLARVAVIASTGDISIPAFKWARGAGVGLIIIDPFDGQVLATSAHTSNDDPRLRRAQALAVGTSTGVDIVRWLLGRKLAGQARVATEILDMRDAAESIDQVERSLDDAGSVDELRQLEAVGANVYFAAWHGLTVPFVTKDRSRVEPEWLIFEGRRSAVNAGSARNATDPLNAILSWCYRIAEAETRLACLAVGLDPGLGILHADVKGRDSMVLDLIEPLRPTVDAYVLRFLERRPLRKADLISDPRGVVRLRASLTWDLTTGIDLWRGEVGGLVEHVADMLGASSPYDVSVPSVLTGSKHRLAARARTAAAPAAPPTRPAVTGATNRKKSSRRTAPAKGPARRCLDCGAVLRVERGRAVSRLSYCPDCLPARKAESTKVAQRASVGRTANAHDALATQHRRAANAEQRLAEQTFELAHEGEAFDRARFLAEVLPRLQSVSTTTIAKATGMSTSSASKVKRGLRVPHPRWWGVLAEITLSPRHSRTPTETV